MRIIAGIHKSRKLNTLEGLTTRPMMDRMKESIFNTIGPYFDNDIVLDLFGGSGALSLEAISRGCAFSYIVEIDKAAIEVINSNVKLLKEESHVQIINSDYKKVLSRFANEAKKFDIIFLDPPYKLNIINDIIEFITLNSMLNENGVIICQYVHKNYIPKESDYLEIIKNYNYSNSEVCIYSKK